MSEDLKTDTGSTQPREESEVVMLIKQVQQQMVYLEKKLDLLLAQAPQKSFRENTFSRPRRPFGDSFRHGKGRPDHSRSGAGSFSHDRPAYDRPRESGFSSEGRKNFSQDRGVDRSRSFDRPQASGNYKPFPSKERFFGKKRERKPH